MAILDGLRGGQYFGFAPQNAPVINRMEMLPTQAASSPVSESTDTGDFTPVDTWAGDTENYNASYTQGMQEIAQGKEYLNKANAVSRGLIRLGVNKNDKIAIISSKAGSMFRSSLFMKSWRHWARGIRCCPCWSLRIIRKRCS